MKRVILMLTAALIAALTSVAAAREAQGRPGARGAVAAESPCARLVGSIERLTGAIEDARGRLRELMRVATDAEREQIERTVAEARDRLEEARARYADAIDRIAGLSPEQLAEACPSIESRLAEMRTRLLEERERLAAFERDLRRRVATGKRAARAMRVTDDMIKKAARLTRATDNGDEAFAGLRRAYEMQENAKQAFAAGRYEAALKMTLGARDVLGETIRGVLDEQDREQVKARARALYEQTVAALERIESALDSSQNPKAARLIAMAEAELDRARETAEDQPYVAIRHLQRARRIVGEMRQFYFRAQNCDSRVERQRERLAAASDLVEESGEQRAVEVLDKAREHHQRGAELCESGDARQATVQLDIAAKLIARAVDRARDISRADKAIAREIKKTALIVGKATEAADTDREKKRAARAEELVNEARERIDQPRVSLKLLDKATDIAFSVLARDTRESASGEGVTSE